MGLRKDVALTLASVGGRGSICQEQSSASREALAPRLSLEGGLGDAPPPTPRLSLEGGLGDGWLGGDNRRDACVLCI